MKRISHFQKNLFSLPFLFTSPLFHAALPGILTVLIILAVFALIAVWSYKLDRFRRRVTIGSTVRFQTPYGIVGIGEIIRIPTKNSVLIRTLADNSKRFISINKIYPV